MSSDVIAPGIVFPEKLRAFESPYAEKTDLNFLSPPPEADMRNLGFAVPYLEQHLEDLGYLVRKKVRECEGS